MPKRARKKKTNTFSKLIIASIMAVFVGSLLYLYMNLPKKDVMGASTSGCGSEKYVKCLKDQYSIDLQGSTNKSTQKFFYTSFSGPFSYQKYLDYFKAAGITIAVSSDYDYYGAWARTNPEGKKIILYQAFFKKANDSYKKYILVHETAHTVGNTNDYLQQDLYNQVYKKGLDLNCFYKGILKTYPTNLLSIASDKSKSRVHETFAESVADTILCNNSGTCPSRGGGGHDIRNFPKSCPNTYSFITKNVLNSNTTSGRNQ